MYCGVVPEETGILGVTVPKKTILPVPEEAVPRVKWVIVPPVPPVEVGKATVATGELDWADEAVKPPVVLATATRA